MQSQKLFHFHARLASISDLSELVALTLLPPELEKYFSETYAITSLVLQSWREHNLNSQIKGLGGLPHGSCVSAFPITYPEPYY